MIMRLSPQNYPRSCLTAGVSGYNTCFAQLFGPTNKTRSKKRGGERVVRCPLEKIPQSRRTSKSCSAASFFGLSHLNRSIISSSALYVQWRAARVPFNDLAWRPPMLRRSRPVSTGAMKVDFSWHLPDRFFRLDARNLEAQDGS